MRLLAFWSVFAVLTVACASGPVMALADAPHAEKKPVRLEKHGHVRIDDYFWLRERDNPKVIDYLKAENDYLERALAPVASLREQLFQEMKSRIKKDRETAPYRDNGYVYSVRMKAGLQYPMYLRRKGTPTGPEEVLLDVNEVAKGQTYTSCSSPKVSDDTHLMVYGCDLQGSRFYTLRVKDLRTGADLGVEIRDITPNVVWAADNRHFFYVRQDPRTLRHYQVWRYNVVTKENQLIDEEKDPTFDVDILSTLAKKHLFIVSSSTLSTEVRFLDRAKPLGKLKVFQPREREHEYQVWDGGDRFFIVTNWKAKDFRLMESPLHFTGKRAWKEIVPHRPGTLLNGIEAFHDWLVLEQQQKELGQLVVLDRRTGKQRLISFQDDSYMVSLQGNAEYHPLAIRYEYESMLQPETTFDYNPATGVSHVVRVKEVPNFDPAKYRTERLWVTARDGRKLPVSLLMQKDAKTDSTRPMLVYGYGAYGVPSEPSFSSNIFSLIDRGWVYAMTHIRGGSELRRAHYEDGRKSEKMNTFTDFIDSTEELIKRGYADRKRIYAEGSSAGGLLVGAVMNLRPALYQGIVATMPFVDVLTTMLDDSIPLTTDEYDEWGNPNKKSDYYDILQYSPYDNVSRTAYPHVLVTAGLHDSRVQYWEPAKWVAKLREYKTNHTLTLLKTDLNAGHGGVSGRYEALKDDALEQAFLLFVDR
jgi:oligopeptidase B